MTAFLLVLNVLVLAIGMGGQYILSTRTSELREFNAGKIRFWSQPGTEKPAPPAVAVAEAPAAISPSPAETVARLATAGSVCIEIAELSQARYQEMKASLKSAGLGTGQCAYGFDKKLGWWVFWPPEYEAAQREKAIQAIRAAGVNDVLPITQGAMAQSFSLGVFASEIQANQYRDALRGKGLGKVEFGPRPSMAWGRLACTLDEPARLDAFVAGLPGWAKAVDIAKCPSAGTPPAGAGTVTPPPR